MFNLVTFKDILDAITEELKLDPNDSKERDRLRRDTNLCYINTVAPAKRWPWLRGNTQIEHKPMYTDGTVACTPDSTTITFSVAPSTSKTGYLFAIDSFSEIYQISAHTAGATTATLVTPFTGTLQTAAEFSVWTDTVVLPTDCRETIEVYHSFFRQPMEGVGLQELRRRVADGPFTTGRPEIYSTYDFVGTTESSRYRVMKIHPSRYTNSTTLSVDYVTEITALDLDADEPAMPVEDRVVLVYGALERAWKRFRNPEASEQSRRDFQEKLAQMSGRVEDSQDQAQLTPSSQYLARKRGRMATKANASTGTGSGSYTAPTYLAGATINGATVTGNITVNSGITVDGVDISVLSSDFSAHLADTTDAHDASAISFSPTGTIAATDVQSAIAEVSGDVTSLGTLTSAHLYVGNASNVATDVAVTGDIAITNAGVTSISSGVIVNDDVSASAAVALSKLAATTASRALVSDGSGVISPATTTATEIGYVNGVTSAIQTQINTKAPAASPTFTGTVTTPVTASRALVTGASSELAASATTSTELGYVSGVTSAIQTQINTKSPAASPTFTGTVTTPVTASRALVTGASSELAASAVTATELGYVSGVTSAIQTQINALASSATSQKDLINLGLACSVGSSALTIALKQSDGSTDPSTGTAAVKIGMRSSTLTSGAYNQRSVTGALSVVVSSGSTLGHVSAVNRYIYVYAIDNAGTIELAVSSQYYDGGAVVSTTAEGGAGAADTNAAIYSTTARSNVPIRCIGRLKSNQTTAGTWAAAPTEVSVGDSWNDLEKSTITLDAHAGFGSTATKVAYFTNSTVVGTAMTLTKNDSTDGCKITINEPGLYAMMYMTRYGASAEEYIGIGLNATVTTGVTTLTAATRLAAAGNVNVAVSGNCILCASVVWPLNVGDVITPHHTIPTTPSTTSISTFRVAKLSQNSVV